jgi:alanine dehydrogenase
MLVLGRAEVERLLPMPQCIELMESALASLARGEVLLPLRQVLRIPGSPNVFALMPAHSAALEALGAKLITVFPGNHGTARASHQGVVLLFHAGHGGIAAMMDAASITAIRTAAVSGLATRMLAREDVRVGAIIGAGVQARTHVDAILAVRRLERIHVWSRTRSRAVALVEQLQHGREDVRFVVMDSARDAVATADVVCTVTASHQPVVQGDWLRPGTHVNAVGASIPTARELDTGAVRLARLFVDRRESALAESGDVLIPMQSGTITADHIRGELGEVLIGAVAGRTSPSDVTLFKSLGIAIEDLACAHYLLAEAGRVGAGTWVDL